MARRFTYGPEAATVMVDVLRMPDNSFGYVPTPALVAPIEFSMSRDEST